MILQRIHFDNTHLSDSVKEFLKTIKQNSNPVSDDVFPDELFGDFIDEIMNKHFQIDTSQEVDEKRASVQDIIDLTHKFQVDYLSEGDFFVVQTDIDDILFYVSKFIPDYSHDPNKMPFRLIDIRALMSLRAKVIMQDMFASSLDDMNDDHNCHECSKYDECDLEIKSPMNGFTLHSLD